MEIFSSHTNVNFVGTGRDAGGGALTPEAIVKAIKCAAPGLAGGPRPVPNGMDEEVAKRRAIVRSDPNLSARELCELFDHRQVPVPRRWKSAGIEWWTKAYQQRRFRGRVQALISKDRTRH